MARFLASDKTRLGIALVDRLGAVAEFAFCFGVQVDSSGRAALLGISASIDLLKE
jgi:hypothetical protein